MRPTDSRTADSIALIRDYQGGNRAALDRLVERYYDRVVPIVRSRMGPWLREVESVEDLVQETFLAAVREFDRFEIREERALIHWLAKLAERRILNAARHHRRAKRDHRRVVRLPSPSPGSRSSMMPRHLAANTTAIPDRVARSEVRAALEACLQRLPQRERDVVLLRSYAGESWASVAASLGLPSAEAARKLHARTRGRLAQMLRERPA